jgi:hypothetical protein
MSVLVDLPNAFRNRQGSGGADKVQDMLAPLLTFAFLAAAVLAGAVIAASLAKGLAAASSLRRELALCSDERLVTVRHQRIVALRVTPKRAAQRPVRSPFALPHRPARRAAA